MSKILIKNGKVWDGERFYFADVLTDNEKISRIGDKIDEVVDFEYDASGKIVSAGLVDSHVHMRGISLKKFGIQAEMSSFPFGVTMAADASGIYGNEALLDSFLLKNLVFVCAEFKDNKAIFENTEKMLKQYGKRVAGIKVYFDVHISEVTDIEPLRQVVEYAEKKNLIVMVHTSNSPVSMSEIVDALNKGDIITHAYHGGINNASYNDFESLKKAKEKGIIIDAGFAGTAHADFTVFENAIKNGCAPDTISTDITKFSAYKRGGRYGMTMCMSIAKTLGMSEEEIFKAVTSSASKALCKESEWGYLKVGRYADVAVFDYRDEVFCLTGKGGKTVEGAEGYRCVLTILDGEIVYRD